MKKADVIKQYTTPIAAPAFVQGPHRFKRREYLNITYRTDREALAKLVPEPLEIDQRTSTKESHLDQQSRFATKVVRRRPPIRRRSQHSRFEDRNLRLSTQRNKERLSKRSSSS